MTYADIHIERSFPSGGYWCAARVDGYLQRRFFIGYTKREALRLFHDEMNKKGAIA